LVEIRTESRRLGTRSPNWKQRGSRPAATGWDYQEAMVGSARRGGLIRRGPGGGGASRTRTWTERGRTEVRARILGFRLWSLHGILDWAMRRAVSLPPSLSSVSDTQLASRNPTFAASAPRGHPFIRHGAVSEPGVLSLLDRLVRKALLDSNGSGRPRAHHGATVTHGGARLDDRRALWVRSPVV
jgi:hypothetical protein